MRITTLGILIASLAVGSAPAAAAEGDAVLLAEGSGKKEEPAKGAAPGKDGPAKAEPVKPAPAKAPSPDVPPVVDPAPGMAASQIDYFQNGVDGEIFIPIRNLYIPAGKGRQFGNWMGRMFFAEKATWDDNIYATEKDKEDDFIFLSTLGASFVRQGSDFSSEVTLSGTFEAYLDESENNFLDLYGRAGFQYGFRKGFVRFTDVFSRSEDSVQSVTNGVGSGPLVFTGADKVFQVSNEARVVGGYEFTKARIEGSYTNVLRNYGKGLEDLDGMEHVFTLSPSYRVSPKAEVGVEVEYRMQGYEERINNDYDSWAAYATAKYLPTPKVEVYGRLGYLSQDIDEGSGTVIDEEDFSGFAGRAGLLWKATAKVKADLFLSQDIHPVQGANYQYALLAGTSIAWEIDPLWKADFRLTWQDSDPSAGEDQGYYTGSGRLGYRMSDWTELAFQYELRARSSSTLHSDFMNHRVSLQLSLLF